MANSALSPWSAPSIPEITSSEPQEIVAFGKPQLSIRDMKSIISAFDSGSYEMVSTYVWTKASGVLKQQIASLGMDFVGEMLKRNLTEDSDPARLSDVEALNLAEDLGMVSRTESLRLNQALELVVHFNRVKHTEEDDEYMSKEEAISLLKSCTKAILSKPKLETALKFVQFRSKLSAESLRAEDFTALQSSPYFFLRTTLSLLLSLIKIQKSAAQEHALGNMSVVLPLIWGALREPEKWQVGNAYAEMAAAGNRVAATGLKAALLKVHGFDFVPESLRSNTFTEAAANVLVAHFGFNNFYNEEKPLTVLANLGTAIPRPAFANCMEATLAVWLGNQWGNAFASEEPATKIFSSLRTEQWEYYINECLQSDKTILGKLAYHRKPITRWIELVKTYFKVGFVIKNQQLYNLMEATTRADESAIKQAAQLLRQNT